MEHGLVVSVRHTWDHVDVLRQCHVLNGRVSLKFEDVEFLEFLETTVETEKPRYSGGVNTSGPVNGITCISTTSLQTSFLVLEVGT